MHRRRTPVTVVLLGTAFVALALIICLRWANPRRITVEMRWSNAPPTGMDQRLLRLLSDGDVRLQFVDASDNYFVVNHPGLLARLHIPNRKEVAVEFKAARELWSGRPDWFTVRSIAGIDLENTAWTGSQDLDPLASSRWPGSRRVGNPNRRFSCLR